MKKSLFGVAVLTMEVVVLKRRFLLLTAILAALGFCLARPALALSGADYKKMLGSSPEFAAADARLNKAWKDLSGVTPKQVMTGYREAQQNWNKTVRDNLARQIEAVGKAGKEFYPDAPLEGVTKKGRVDRGLTYAKVTEERAVFLEELVKQGRDKKYVPSFEGKLGFSHGAYTFTPKGWWSEFIFCWASSEATAAEDASKILEDADGPVNVKVSGRLYGGLSDGEENVFGFDCENAPDTLKVEKAGTSD